MGTSSRAKLIAILFTVALVTAFALAIYPARQRTKLEASLTRAARMYRIGYSSHIVLRDFTEFTWQELQIFPPDTSDQAIIDNLGFYWPQARTNRLVENSDKTLLLFIFENKVVQWVEMPRDLSDYASISDRSPFTPENAFFFLPSETSPEMQVLR